ncbi:hypothetical protein ABKN59_008427 [Abortiporus biennis]
MPFHSFSENQQEAIFEFNIDRGVRRSARAPFRDSNRCAPPDHLPGFHCMAPHISQRRHVKDVQWQLWHLFPMDPQEPALRNSFPSSCILLPSSDSPRRYSGASHLHDVTLVLLYSSAVEWGEHCGI